MKIIIFATTLLTSSLVIGHVPYNNNGFFNHHYYNNMFHDFDRQFKRLERKIQHLKRSKSSFRSKNKRYFDSESNEYVIQVTINNIAKENLSISINENLINIRGESKIEQQNDNNSTVFSSHFSQSFSLPSDADNDNIRAEFKDNVLTIRIPRQAKPEPTERTIEIR